MSNEDRPFTDEGVARATSLLCSMPEAWVRDLVKFQAHIRVPVAATSHVYEPKRIIDVSPWPPVQEIPIADAVVAAVGALKKATDNLREARTEGEKSARLCKRYRDLLLWECQWSTERIANATEDFL